MILSASNILIKENDDYKMKIHVNKSDLFLIKKSKEGSKDAIACLIKRYQHIVKHKAKRYSHHSNDLDDFIQEGLIALYEAIFNFKKEKETSFSTFIEICIDRKLTSYIRLKTTAKANLLSDATSIHNSPLSIPSLITSVNTLPEYLLLKKAKSTMLQRCILQKLTLQESKVVLAYLQEETLTDISKKLNTSYKSVDNAMQRSIKKLRECIEK